MAEPAVTFPTTLDTDTQLLAAVNQKQTTLSGSHTAAVTTLNVASTTGFPSNGYILVEGASSWELVHYTGTGATTFTGCTRGADGTTGVVHVDAQSVKLVWNAAFHNLLVDAIQALEAKVGVDSSAVATSIDYLLTTHTAATAAHGATGAVVGTTNTQTLTNKTLTSPVINGTVTTTGLTMPAFTAGGDIIMTASYALRLGTAAGGAFFQRHAANPGDVILHTQTANEIVRLKLVPSGTPSPGPFTEVRLYRTDVGIAADPADYEFLGWNASTGAATPDDADYPHLYELGQYVAGAGVRRAIGLVGTPQWLFMDYGTSEAASMAVILDRVDMTGAGKRDSPGLWWSGKAYDASAHRADWKVFADLTSNAGASTLTLQTRIDAAAFGSKLTITDAGAVALFGTLTLGGHVTGGNYNLNNIGHAGFGNQASDANVGVFSQELVTNPGADKQGVWGNMQVKSTAGALAYVNAGVRGIGWLHQDNTQNWTATLGLIGLHATIGSETGATGTVTGAAGVFSDTYWGWKAATLTNYYGGYFANPSGAGTITNAYGLYIENITKGATLNYALYAAGGLVYLGGAVTLGSTLTPGGDIVMGANNITFTSGLVDGVDVSAHAPRHEIGGTDAVAAYASLFNWFDKDSPVSAVPNTAYAAIGFMTVGYVDYSAKAWTQCRIIVRASGDEAGANKGVQAYDVTSAAAMCEVLWTGTGEDWRVGSWTAYTPAAGAKQIRLDWKGSSATETILLRKAEVQFR